jgi:predicted nucleic acid-binding Zn ribbon protein
MTTQSTDDAVLSFDPFEGDFGIPGDKIFSNRMAIARKPGPCSHCGTDIAKGERIRRQTSKFDGELMTHRWCALCCTAMASYDTEACDADRDDLPEYEKRSGLATRAAQEDKKP